MKILYDGIGAFLYDAPGQKDFKCLKMNSVALIELVDCRFNVILVVASGVKAKLVMFNSAL